MKSVTLPNNAFGVVVFLVILALVFIIPFTISLWLIGMFAPSWVAVPVSIGVGVGAFIGLVKFN